MMDVQNSRLDWTLVMSESDKTLNFMDVAVFDITLVTVAARWYGIHA